MVTLTIKNGARREVQSGLVDVNGPVVALYAVTKGKDSHPELVFAYHMHPGDQVQSDGKGNYCVEF